MFSGLRRQNRIFEPLESQTRFSLDNRPEKSQLATSSQIWFHFFLHAVFAVIVSNGQIMIGGNLYVCDDNGSLHSVDYPFICNLVASLCNTENMFLLDYSWYLTRSEYKFKYPHEYWGSSCFAKFLAEWKQTKYKCTISKKYFSHGRFVFDSSKRGFRIPFLDGETMIMLPQYYGPHHLCALTTTNLILLQKLEEN